MPGDLLIQTLKHVWVSLDKYGLPMAVMGGIAAAMWERVRATQDVDLLIQAPADLDSFIAGLERLGIRPKKRPALVTVGDHQFVQMIYEPKDAFIELQIDLLLATTEYQRQALARRVPGRLPNLDLDIFILSCEDLILHKLLAGRILDRSDVVALLQSNRPSLNFDYLREWKRKLSLEAEWQDVWSQAFPKEAVKD